jgi:predicted neutral ceramidase superfamily lipid hydrolase
MMTKTQKIWMWIFLAMFAIPEILFFNLISFPLYFLTKGNITMASLIFGNSYLFSPFSFLVILCIEIIGALGLFVLSIKSNKKIMSVLLGAISLLLVAIFYFVYGASNMSL